MKVNPLQILSFWIIIFPFQKRKEPELKDGLKSGRVLPLFS